MSKAHENASIFKAKYFDEWEGFYVKDIQIELPVGEMVSPQ